MPAQVIFWNLVIHPRLCRPSLPREAHLKSPRPRRVAVWYGGFGEATTRLDGIVPWLDGQADEVLIPTPRQYLPEWDGTLVRFFPADGLCGS